MDSVWIIRAEIWIHFTTYITFFDRCEKEKKIFRWLSLVITRGFTVYIRSVEYYERVQDSLKDQQQNHFFKRILWFCIWWDLIVCYITGNISLREHLLMNVRVNTFREFCAIIVQKWHVQDIETRKLYCCIKYLSILQF